MAAPVLVNPDLRVLVEIGYEPIGERLVAQIKPLANHEFDLSRAIDAAQACFGIGARVTVEPLGDARAFFEENGQGIQVTYGLKDDNQANCELTKIDAQNLLAREQKAYYAKLSLQIASRGDAPKFTSTAPRRVKPPKGWLGVGHWYKHVRTGLSVGLEQGIDETGNEWHLATITARAPVVDMLVFAGTTFLGPDAANAPIYLSWQTRSPGPPILTIARRVDSSSGGSNCRVERESISSFLAKDVALLRIWKDEPESCWEPGNPDPVKMPYEWQQISQGGICMNIHRPTRTGARTYEIELPNGSRQRCVDFHFAEGEIPIELVADVATTFIRRGTHVLLCPYRGTMNRRVLSFAHSIEENAAIEPPGEGFERIGPIVLDDDVLEDALRPWQDWLHDVS
ncbi:hypothetical protein [Pendulispora albinea]|uniref:Uncharacterized protein n=1 Tax=Pendulispora albinea TaxID=2741071 RepID=A0ABZ2M3Y4_9BACT